MVQTITLSSEEYNITETPRNMKDESMIEYFCCQCHPIKEHVRENDSSCIFSHCTISVQPPLCVSPPCVQSSFRVSPPIVLPPCVPSHCTVHPSVNPQCTVIPPCSPSLRVVHPSVGLFHCTVHPYVYLFPL